MNVPFKFMQVNTNLRKWFPKVFRPCCAWFGGVLALPTVAGVCHHKKNFENAGFKLQAPIALGHEASGTIVEIGHDVTDLSIGDKVAITPVMNFL